MASGAEPIRFRDRSGGNGLSPLAHRRVEFLNESGERRVATVVPMDDRAWAEVAEHAVQVLLRQADPS